MVLAIIIALCGCTAAKSNLSSDFNSYTVPLYLVEYTPNNRCRKIFAFQREKDVPLQYPQ